MSSKDLKKKEEMLALLYIREYITETQYLKTLERIRKENKK